MDKLHMQSKDLTAEKFAKLAELFPHAITETITGYDDDDKAIIERAVDPELLQQEINAYVLSGKEERYQFTWPDKRRSIVKSNSPATVERRDESGKLTEVLATLRPYREESVNFDTTENLYIEGDNLDVLKLLRETYLGRVKMIYIDPPYNTGNDFVYNDDFTMDSDAWSEVSGDYDEDGNRMVKNLDSNGRFHTDWLNMMYPRLRVARDLLADDGVIFISIDDGELHNLTKICNEIFGKNNLVACFPWRKRTAKSDVPFGVSQDYEWVLAYARSNLFVASIEGGTRRYYETDDLPGKPWRIHDLTKQTNASERPNSYFTIIDPKTGNEYPANPNRTWAITEDTFSKYYEENRIVFPGDYSFLSISKPSLRYFKEDDMVKAGDRFGFIAVSTKLPDDIGMTQDGTKDIDSIFNQKVFGFPKPVALLRYLVRISSLNNDSIILDFFSGSATTAHAVMQLNAEDGGKRKFIMVQLPEATDEKSEAAKAGYANICEIGKERIRRAGVKIIAETPKRNELINVNDSSVGATLAVAQNAASIANVANTVTRAGASPAPTTVSQNTVDIGFRVLKLDSTNMKDVYYTPGAIADLIISGRGDLLIDNIKEDRSDEDLLFQVMLDLGVPLSAQIEKRDILGADVYYVEYGDGYLTACFGKVTGEIITEIAKETPYFSVFRDGGFENDSAFVNAEQIFQTYSPQTVRRVL